MFLIIYYYYRFSKKNVCGTWGVNVPQRLKAPPCKSSTNINRVNQVCTFAELTYTPSMIKPQEKMVIQTFEESKSIPKPFPYCKSMWYAYRFVTPNGEYGPMSDWSGPISVYEKKLPCAGNKGCMNLGIREGNLKASKMILGIQKEIPSEYKSKIEKGEMVINVHRSFQETPPNNTDGQIVGNMFPTGGSSAFFPLTYFYNDILCNSPDNPSVCIRK